MAPASSLLIFFGLVFGIVLLPGLDMACVLASSLGGGRRDRGSAHHRRLAVAPRRRPTPVEHACHAGPGVRHRGRAQDWV